MTLDSADLYDQYFKLIMMSRSKYEANLQINDYVLNIVEYVAMEYAQKETPETSAETGTEDDE